MVAYPQVLAGCRSLPLDQYHMMNRGQFLYVHSHHSLCHAFELLKSNLLQLASLQGATVLNTSIFRATGQNS